jgi:hypothetical protein
MKIGICMLLFCSPARMSMRHAISASCFQLD